MFFSQLSKLAAVKWLQRCNSTRQGALSAGVPCWFYCSCGDAARKSHSFIFSLRLPSIALLSPPTFAMIRPMNTCLAIPMAVHRGNWWCGIRIHALLFLWQCTVATAGVAPCRPKCYIPFSNVLASSILTSLSAT